MYKLCHLEYARVFNRQPMELLKNSSSSCEVGLIGNNQCQSILDTLASTQVNARQTSEERFATIKTASKQNICHKDCAIHQQILSNTY